MQEGYLGPPIMVGQAKNPVFNSPTPLFKYDILTIKKTQVTFCISSQSLFEQLNRSLMPRLTYNSNSLKKRLHECKVF